MNTQDILTTIEAQRAAWKTVHDLQDQLSAATTDAAKARAKCADLRADDSGDVAELAKALTEQSGIIEIAEARAGRLRKEIDEATKAAEGLSLSPTVGILTHARESLVRYYHNLRCVELIPQVIAWLSPEAVTRRSRWLKSTISDLAQEDERLAEPNALTFMANEPTAKMESDFEETAEYLIRHQDDLPAALEFVAKQEAHLAGIRAKNQIPPIHLWELLDLSPPRVVPVPVVAVAPEKAPRSQPAGRKAA